MHGGVERSSGDYGIVDDLLDMFDEIDDVKKIADTADAADCESTTPGSEDAAASITDDSERDDADAVESADDSGLSAAARLATEPADHAMTPPTTGAFASEVARSAKKAGGVSPVEVPKDPNAQIDKSVRAFANPDDYVPDDSVDPEHARLISETLAVQAGVRTTGSTRVSSPEGPVPFRETPMGVAAGVAVLLACLAIALLLV